MISLEEPLQLLIEQVVGIWNVVYKNGHTDQVTITPRGRVTVKSRGLETSVERSDEPILFPASDGWLMVVGEFSLIKT